MMCPNLQVSWPVGVCVLKVSLLLVPLGLGVESIFFILKHWVSRKEMGEARFFLDETEIFMEGARESGRSLELTYDGWKKDRKENDEKIARGDKGLG